ncbi:MAG: acetamidase/formamidase family protein [Bryobacteraceae bacterium]
MLRLSLCLVLLCPLAAETHKLPASPVTVVWGNYWSGTKPALRIHSGDTVAIQTVSGNPERLESAGVASADIPQALRDIYRDVKDRGPGGHILTGPVYIEEAEPGDVLEVRIREITLPVAWAYNAFRPGAGFLPDDFPYSRFKVVALDREHGVARFASGINIPLRPFYGSMGVAPPVGMPKLDSAPPWVHAGNMDNKELQAGATLYIPVHAKGALFQVGDGHAAQGNGEVDITALETPLDGVFEFHVRKGHSLRWTRAETPTHWITMGFHQDLTEATRLAVRDMIDFLQEKGLTRDDAYMLTSTAVDLSITQLVDGNKGVHASCPKAIFEGRP